MRVLIVDDEAAMRRTTRVVLETSGHAVFEAPDSGQAIKALGQEEVDAVFLDLRLGGEDGLQVLGRLLKMRPGLAVVVFTAFSNIATAVETIRRGAFDFLPKPFVPDQLRSVLARIEICREFDRRARALEGDIGRSLPPADFESNEPAVQQALQSAFKGALTGATILITGSTGTGKGILAREIHRRSALRNRPFVTVCCPSLSGKLLGGELFGQVRGALTGAANEGAGSVAAAEGGTLFLDEVAETPIEIQPGLLQLLRNRVYERVGENRTRRADVRIVAASSRPLAAEVRAGRFREDLYFQLNVIGIALPGLGERRLDHARLADGFRRFYANRFGKKIADFSPEVLAAFARHSWPGNFREMNNVIERAVILASGEVIELRDLPEEFRARSEAAAYGVARTGQD